MIEFTIPIRLVNGANIREHWAKRAKRAKEQRGLAYMYMQQHQREPGPVPPWLVTITRVGKRKMDSDGLAISAKACRDGIAEALGVDDGDEAKITFAYAQEIGKAYAVRVRVETREAGK